MTNAEQCSEVERAREESGGLRSQSLRKIHPLGTEAAGGHLQEGALRRAETVHGRGGEAGGGVAVRLGEGEDDLVLVDLRERGRDALR